MRYVEAKVRQEDVESSYRFFISEALKILTKNTSGTTESAILQMNFPEYLERRKHPKEERTADEIINHIKSKLETIGGQNEHDSI